MEKDHDRREPETVESSWDRDKLWPPLTEEELKDEEIAMRVGGIFQGGARQSGSATSRDQTTT